MQDTKITFSDEELDAALNSRFFFVKQSVTDKVVELLGELERELKKNILIHNLQIEYLNIAQGKIYRGENYKQLPYLLLDYPKLFTKDSSFAFRSMFWWGKEFSFTLHIGGKDFDLLRDKIQSNIHQLFDKNFYLCINNTPWQYHFESDNYILLDELLSEQKKSAFEIMMKERSFIKLSRKLPVQEYDKVINFGVETFSLLAAILS